MKIIIESDNFDFKALIERPEGDIHDFMDAIYSLAIAYGYHPLSVKEGFFWKHEDLEEVDLNKDDKETDKEIG